MLKDIIYRIDSVAYLPFAHMTPCEAKSFCKRMCLADGLHNRQLPLGLLTLDSSKHSKVTLSGLKFQKSKLLNPLTFTAHFLGNYDAFSRKLWRIFSEIMAHFLGNYGAFSRKYISESLLEKGLRWFHK